TGVAWTEAGGDVLYVEATILPGGQGQIVLTGQLGNVMQESARAAVSHIRSNAASLGVSPGFLEHHDLHVHVPAGAIPKDGPSAGVTMGRAIRSGVRGTPIRGEADDGDGDSVGVAANADPRRCGDDRRNHAVRPGAPGRRHSREGAGGA